jgi:hypothetical protein
MEEINVEVIVSNGTNVEVSSPSTSVNAIVNLPAPLESTTDSPSIDYHSHVILPGPQGPQGAQGLVGPQGAQGNISEINNLNAQLIYLTGQDGVNIVTNNYNTIFISGNSGYFQSLVSATNNNLNITGSVLDTKINSQNIILSGYFETENVIGYKANLTPAGYDNYYIAFPQALSSVPKSVVCTFQNTIDNIAYYFTVGSITNAGFDINFSDILLNNGYYLNIQIKK